MLDLEYNSDSGDDTVKNTMPIAPSEASNLELVVKTEDVFEPSANTTTTGESVNSKMDTAKAEDTPVANTTQLENAGESQVHPIKYEGGILNEEAEPQDSKPQSGPDARASDNEAPEETTSTKPVRALEKKRKRNKNKGNKTADTQHHAKRQKGSAGQKEPVAAGGRQDGHAAATVTDESASNAVPEGFCVVCCTAKGKYKCPRCRAQICSVPCSKSHQANHPADPAPAAPAAPPTAVFVAPSQPPSDPSHPFSFLDESPKIHALFAQYPCLASALMTISDAMQPPSSFSSAAPVPFAQSEAKRIEKRLWDKAQGEKHGKAALRRVRALDTTEGEAVRAYCELVLHLMQTKGKGVHEVRKRKAKEERAMFQKLAKVEAKKEGL